MRGKIIFILFMISYSPPVMAGDGDYAVSKIPDALLKNAHVIKRMEKISFEVINTGEAILYKKYALTIMDENGDDQAVFLEYYDKLHEIRNIEGTLYDASGKELKKLKNKQIIDLTGMDESTLMDDSRRKFHRFYYKVYPYTVQYEVEIKYKGKTLMFKMIDTPGIATKIDYEDFIKYNMKKKDAKERAKEATQGVIESIKWLDDMDVVVIVLDASENPYNQVNITIVGNLVARKIPVLIVGNKIDLKKADLKKIESAFPEYDVVGVSAKSGQNFEEFYESIFKLAKSI